MADAKRDLRAASLAEHIRKVAAEAPPLTEAQRTVLHGLLDGAD